MAAAQPLPPQLTQPVNDFAGVIDSESAARMDGMIRSLQKASGGDVVVVATVDTFKPYGDIREYAVNWTENENTACEPLVALQAREDTLRRTKAVSRSRASFSGL